MVLQLCIFAVAAQEAKITIPAGLYTYGEIAQGLSGPGRTIKASSLVADRAAVVRLTDKSPAVALELVRKGLGVALARDGEDYQLVPDPEAEALDTRLFNQFCSTFDKHIQAVMNRAKAISGGAMPLTQEAVQALVKKHVQPDGDMAQLGVEPSKSIDKAALAMLAGASFQDPRVGASGPLYFYFANGGSVRKLIQGDTIETGDACYWRDNTRYPAWVRERAVATVRDAETAAALKFNDPGQAQQEVTRVARNTQITHRIYFDPRTAEIGFTYSILGPLNARTGWYGENKIAALRPPAMSSLPASIYDAVEGAGKHAARLAASSSGAEATNLYAIVSARKAASAAGSVLEWARKGSSDVICEISTVRDWNEVAASPRTTGPFGVWTISSAD
ncbi:MAG TPA: hypothetical protein VEX38_04700, partial [Fimbriimonadaceae bacterium]|nr:hypothetical protein [Fimbriimonadaceae bacterium]